MQQPTSFLKCYSITIDVDVEFSQDTLNEDGQALEGIEEDEQKQAMLCEQHVVDILLAHARTELDIWAKKRSSICLSQGRWI